MCIHVSINYSILAWVLNEGLVKVLRNEITHEVVMNVDKIFMKTINKQHCFYRCRILSVSWVATSSSNGLESHHKHCAARCRTEDSGRHLRKTHKYKQQGKYDLLLTSPARVAMLAVPVTISTIKKYSIM